MNREIYLDNAATTKPLEEVVKAVSETMLKTYGNPSSLHKKGIEAETIIKTASQFFASKIGCLPEEIIYTSGGTESNSTAIIGTAMAYKRRGQKIITSAIEHPSVTEVFKYLETQGFKICTLEVDHEGYVNLEDLEAAIDDETILVSIMHVNNEIGTIQPLEKIGTLIKRKNKETLFHVDAVQSFGKLPIQVKRMQIDLLSISAHKFYGPRGVGLLYKNKQVRLQNLLHGGGQQKNLRSGTENVPGIAGALEACRYMYAKQESLLEHMRVCKKALVDGILQEIPDTWVNGPSLEEGMPYIANIGFKDIRAEVLLHALEDSGIYVSSGSACATHKKVKGGVLTAIGCERHNLDNAIRFSFSHDTTLEDLSMVIEVLKTQVTLLRKYIVGGRK